MSDDVHDQQNEAPGVSGGLKSKGKDSQQKTGKSAGAESIGQQKVNGNAPPPKPPRLSYSETAITVLRTMLGALANEPIFTPWFYQWKGGKWTKPPLCPHGHPGMTFDAALAKFQHGVTLDGIGIKLGVVPGQQIVVWGIDYDGIGKTGKPPPDLWKDTPDLFREASPSGADRFHGLALHTGTPLQAVKQADREIYSEARYLTFTGKWIEGSSTTLKSVDPVPFYQAVGVDNPRPYGEKKESANFTAGKISEADLSDKERRILNAVRRSPIDNPDQSEVDFIVCCKAMRMGATDEETARILCCGWWRDKLAREDYVARTVERAREAVNKQQDQHTEPPTLLDALNLLKAEVFPVNYVIPDWLSEGLTVLAAHPKTGKSTLALQMALAKVRGDKFWGSTVPKGKVLMIDLETNSRRLRRKLEQAEVKPRDLEDGCLMYQTEWKRGPAAIDDIGLCLDANPDIKLVIIDTLQKIRDMGSGKGNAYERDYAALAPLHDLCKDRPGLAIIVIHHLRKGATDDPIESLTGSMAISGVADGIWIMKREKIDGARTFKLYIQGRDWERNEDEFFLMRENGKWNVTDQRPMSEHDAYVIDLLHKSQGMTAPQVAGALGVGRQAAYERLNRMREQGLVDCINKKWYAQVNTNGRF